MNSQIINTLINTLALIVTLSLISGSVQGTGFDDPHQTPGVYSLDGVSMLGGGSQKSNNYDHKWLDNYLRDQYRIHVDGHIHGLSITKPESFQTNGEWNIQRVHRGKLFSWMSDRSLALDANGKPHIAYGQTHLYYARYDEEWHIETVDDSWDVGWYASLALDSDGYPHISYYDRDPNGDLKYAYKDENGWHITTVDDDGTVGLFTSIALDANNHPHISYFDDTNGNLKYAYWDGSDWLIQTIDSEGVVGYWRTSLAIDSNDFPHISYFDYTNKNLKYIHWDGNDWQVVTVDNDDDVGGYSSLALDENGYAHISYLDYANARMKYAFWNGSEWQREIVDEGEDWGVGWYNSIVLDVDENPHISYFDNTNGKMKYAYLNGSEWDIRSVSAIIPDEYPWDSSYNIGGFFTSIVLDLNGNPHISSMGRFDHFGAYPDYLLGYSYFDGSKWNFDAVDTLISAGITTSIAVDNDAVSYIGYMRSDGRYSYTSSVDYQWGEKTFGRVAYGIKEPGSGSFIALDNDGWPHMIYHQEHGALASRYGSPVAYYPFRRAWFDGTDWCYEHLWTSYQSGSGNTKREPLSSSLTFDQYGMPHIIVSSKITYWNFETSYQLHHLYFSGNEWNSSRISRSGWQAVGIDNSIAISSDGIPHVCYRGLRYGRFEEEEWNIEAIDSVGGGYFNSLKLDSNNYPHISYYDTLNTVLKYARWDDSEWQIEIVDNNGDVGKYTSLDLDANDFPHISYYDETNGNLKYAYWDGIGWQIESIDSYRDVGLYTSLALDANGHPHISYFDTSFGDLKYATKVEPTFVKTKEELPDKVTLYQNYPNPFNPATTIQYDLPDGHNVIITVYNILGQEVIRVIDEEITAGTHEVVFDASALPSGVYIYRLQAGEYVESKKMLYLK